jgi:DNA-binding CsgD family transcriptional regulator/chaperonin cofactor prefoldin
LLAATVVAAVEYYGQIRKAQKEYEKAKGIVEDIVLSFSRELKRGTDKLDLIAFKIEGNLAKADTSLKKVDTLEKRMAPIENQIGTISQTASQSSNSILSGLTNLELKIKDIEASQEKLKVKLAGFEEQIQKVNITPEISEPVIPIKRDKAIAALTDTEITVLEMLSSEGPKTAPEIKDRVKLSREHTARLMKKLYEEGYLEREIGKIPFRYSIKKEMEKMLKKPENSQPT